MKHVSRLPSRTAGLTLPEKQLGSFEPYARQASLPVHLVSLHVVPLRVYPLGHTRVGVVVSEHVDPLSVYPEGHR